MTSYLVSQDKCSTKNVNILIFGHCMYHNLFCINHSHSAYIHRISSFKTFKESKFGCGITKTNMGVLGLEGSFGQST